MSIQWYPGHMVRARKAMEESFPNEDVIIEVLDARMPRSSANPVVTEVRRHKPCLKVLSKSDLADPAVTEAWLADLEREATLPTRGGPVLAVALTTKEPAIARKRIAELCKRLALHPSGPGKTVRATIVGVPNAGKSTLINTLMERKVAKVGDQPAVTRGQQRVILKSGMILSDNPGLMWPKIEDVDAGYRLAFGGAVPDAAIDYDSVAVWGAGFLLARYPARLRDRYKLETTPASAMDLLNEIGRRRGGLRSGGVIDVHKAADALIHDFRRGALGRISLEAPPGVAAWGDQVCGDQ